MRESKQQITKINVGGIRIIFGTGYVTSGSRDLSVGDGVL